MKDWIGLWFEIQAARGHSDEVPLLLVHLPERRVENHSFLHRRGDGVAALSTIFKEKGLEPRRAGRTMPRPPWVSFPRLLARGLKGNSEGAHPAWRIFRPGQTQKPRHFQFLLLDDSANSELARYLRERRISLSAYLLASLTRAVSGELCEGPASGSWLLPVDMRPAFPRREPRGNCVSYIRVRAESDAAAIHQRIKGAIQAFEHWSNWWVYHIGKVVGYRGMRRLSRRSSERTFWLGSFTDLGDWTPRESPAADRYRDSLWAITAPGTPNNPVSCATIAWFGRRSISLRIHPAISADCAASARAVLSGLAEDLRAIGIRTELIETEIPGPTERSP